MLAWVPLSLLLLAVSVPAQVLPGQIVIDGEHPQWLKRHGGGHVFICGPGDPEDFLYRGTLLPNGTRDGDQDEIIDKLIADGGNCLYFEVVRSHGGDGGPDHNPFIGSNPSLGLDQDILNQWEGWLDRTDQAGILAYMFLYDDGSSIWPGGDAVPLAEKAFVTAIVDRFEHHPSLIWLVAEESEEAFSHARVRNIAQVIADVDEHNHVIGNHHHPGTSFLAWQPGSALRHFSMQTTTPAASTHAMALEARALAEAAGTAGNGYMVIYSEAAFTLGASVGTIRAFLWDSAMAGVMPMVYGMDVATTPSSALRACRTVQQFFESTDFRTMAGRDDLAAGGTRWVLADPPFAYIAYSAADLGPLGLAGMTPGFYDLHWVDAVTGATASQSDVVLTGGTNSFARPAGIGPHCALSVSRVWRDLGWALAGSSGLPRLDVECNMVADEPLTLILQHAAPLAPLTIAVGLTTVGQPFAGGLFVPQPQLLVQGQTSAGGTLVGQATWPAGFLSGASLFVQVWIQDPTGPQGWTASNAVQGMAP